MNGIYLWINIFDDVPIWVIAVIGLFIGTALGKIHRKIDECRSPSSKET